MSTLIDRSDWDVKYYDGDTSGFHSLAEQVSPPKVLTQAQTIAGHYWKGL